MKRCVALTGVLVCLVVVSPASGAKKPSNWSVTPTKLNFGNLPVGGQGVMLVTVTNTSAVTEQVAGAHVDAGLGDFNVQGSSSCTPALFVPAGGSCTVNVAFDPQATGSRRGTLQIDLNPGPPAQVALSGRGT